MKTVDLPGGRVVLGLEGRVRDVLARHMPAKSFARFDEEGVITSLARSPVKAGAYFTKRRTVTIAPLTVEVEATPFTDFVKPDDDVDDVLARACGDRWRLPTPDEWEYLYAAGARTLFPWGDEWRVKPKRFANAFGLAFAFDTECTSKRRVLGGGDPSGWSLNGFDGTLVYASSYFMHESHVAHFEWEAYEASGIRRIRKSRAS